ncbi:hypothetical protein H5410_060685 [Solanum commersonii]|uniref:Uncharacterized protein n=1 Tax=Solanum commersonii TaxID=4109 RepID=A0A9J5W6D7_SOLCO|nr:hypothetical protein H5410_060685 [Solanum commersonii]
MEIWNLPWLGNSHTDGLISTNCERSFRGRIINSDCMNITTSSTSKFLWKRNNLLGETANYKGIMKGVFCITSEIISKGGRGEETEEDKSKNNNKEINTEPGIKIGAKRGGYHYREGRIQRWNPKEKVSEDDLLMMETSLMHLMRKTGQKNQVEENFGKPSTEKDISVNNSLRNKEIRESTSKNEQRGKVSELREISNEEDNKMKKLSDKIQAIEIEKDSQHEVEIDNKLRNTKVGEKEEEKSSDQLNTKTSNMEGGGSSYNTQGKFTSRENDQ